MSENEKLPEQSSGDDPKHPFAEDPDLLDPPQGERVIGQRVRLFVLRAIAMVGVFVLLLVLLTGSAGWYTSRPQFCRSCHIMEPYYVSWQESSHRDVSCIKCHFPPGVGEKVRGKLLGLVQLAKYVTASAGPRPAAEIPDASCLRSGCHETRLLAGRVDFEGIPFDHTPHLEQLRRDKQLRCTSCHSQIVQGTHMNVTTTTCFLCHFKDGFFNEGLGACTRCHQIPEEEYDLGGGVKFHHNLAYEKGVDCANCHGDLIQGNGEVPRERCTVCHNREDDLKRINDDVFLHRIHVTDHKVDCLACHLHIEHSLDEQKLTHTASNCASCHPNHHREQVDMLHGVGGTTIPSHASSMAVARIACPSCHRLKEVSATGAVLMKASLETCSTCHETERIDDLQQYGRKLEEAVSKLEADLPAVRSALESASLDDGTKADLTSQLADVETDLRFLRVGNGIHNIHYAGALARAVTAKLFLVCSKLNIEPPEVTLPDWGVESL